jgi:DNA-binding SARP family transcriptional activator
MYWIFLDGNVLRGPKATVVIPSGMLCTLAAVLVMNHDRPVPRDRLGEILWDGEIPDRSRDRINTMLWRLRRMVTDAGGVRDCFVNHHDYLMYRPGQAAESDVLTVSVLARRLLQGGIDSPQMVEECLACVDACHTDFLPFASDHWSILTRESLRSGLLMALEALLSYMRAQGRWGRVSELAERILVLDPTLEVGHRQLIDLHGQRQDYKAALRHYKVLEHVLRDSVGELPAPETAAAIDALRIARSHGRPAGTEMAGPMSAPVLRQAPSIRAVEVAIHHLDVARDSLTGRSHRS